jgi:hypothetical protein
MDYTVYKVTSPSNKVYIGLTKKTLDFRMRQHVNISRTNPKSIFHKAILKYGINNLICEVVKNNLSRNEAEELEIELIKLYKSTDTKFGYNMCKGGHGGDISTVEGKLRRKEKMDLYFSNPEYIKKLSIKMKEDKARLDNLQIKNRESYKNEERKNKNREHLLRLHSNPENARKRALSKGGKEFRCIETNERFFTLKEAAISLGFENVKIAKTGIHKALKKQRKSYKNYHFEYLETT